LTKFWRPHSSTWIIIKKSPVNLSNPEGSCFSLSWISTYLKLCRYLLRRVSICQNIMPFEFETFRVMYSIQVRRDINWNVHLDTRRNGLVSIILEPTILSKHWIQFWAQTLLSLSCNSSLFLPTSKKWTKAQKNFLALMRTSDEKTAFVSTRAKSID
jgi:hypothetical protein